MGLCFCNLTLDSYLKSDGRPAQIWANAGVSLSLDSLIFVLQQWIVVEVDWQLSNK